MINSSVHNYNKALKLFKEVRDLWDNLEDASDYEYMEALDKVDALKKHVNKINISDIEDYLSGREETLQEVKHNISVFKEGTYRMGREILGWSYYRDLLDAVPRYVTALQKKYPSKYPDKDIAKRFINEIIHPSNIDRYKKNIESIIRGNMTIPYFARIFDAAISGTKPKSNDKKIKPQVNIPPMMFTGKERERWEESTKKHEEEYEETRKKKSGGMTTDKPEEFTKKGKSYIKTPSGKEFEYDFETKSKDGAVHYYNGNKEVYSYMTESIGPKFVCEGVEDVLRGKTKQDIMDALPGREDATFKPNKSKMFSGSFLIGYVNTSYNNLVMLFGKPNTIMDGYKISTTWHLESDRGDFVMIYDYKETNLYDPALPSVEEFRSLPTHNWHIGGFDKQTANDLITFIYMHDLRINRF